MTPHCPWEFGSLVVFPAIDRIPCESSPVILYSLLRQIWIHPESLTSVMIWQAFNTYCIGRTKHQECIKIQPLSWITTDTCYVTLISFSHCWGQMGCFYRYVVHTVGTSTPTAKYDTVHLVTHEFYTIFDLYVMRLRIELQTEANQWFIAFLLRMCHGRSRISEQAQTHSIHWDWGSVNLFPLSFTLCTFISLPLEWFCRSHITAHC